MSRLSRWSLVVSLVALLMSIITLIFAIQVSRSTSELKQTLSENSQPAEVASPVQTEAQMLQQFRPASLAEVAAIKSLSDLKGSPWVSRIYVATAKDVTLVPVDKPMLLVLPKGHVWKSGPLSLITIVRVDSASLYDLTHEGVIYSNPLCTAQLAGILKGDCHDPSLQQAGDRSEMLTHLRHPTEIEMKRFLGVHYTPGVTDSYYVATSDFVAAPEYRFDEGDPDASTPAASSEPAIIDGIFVPAGVRLLGGQLGFMDIYPVGKMKMTSLDTTCFLYQADNDLGPKPFVPASELKRVERCDRSE